MRRLAIVVLCLSLLGPAPLFAAGEPAAKAAAPGEFSIVGKDKAERQDDFRFRLGEVLQIKATGDLAEKIRAEWPRTKALALYFDGERIASLQAPPQQRVQGGEILMNFPLVRDAQNKENRHAWDRLFRTKTTYLMDIQPSLAIGNELPIMVQSAYPLQFYVAANWVIWLTVLAGLVILVFACWYLVNRTSMLKDADSNYYSLGKSQMAFWGLLVVLSFAGIWILTGTMERIPPQELILLGISGATGLSAVVIGKSKKTGLKNRHAASQTELDDLHLEAQRLQNLRSDPEVLHTHDDDHQLAVVQAAITAQSKIVGDLAKQLETGVSNGFWRDICDDGNGPSFHRLQVVIWTIVLGTVFIYSVARVMSMPEFQETLLTLMGISNATYLGFKIPENA